MSLTKEEVLAFLPQGMDAALSPEMETLLEVSIHEMEAAAQPRSCYGVYDLGRDGEGNFFLPAAELTFRGKNIAEHLASCDACVLTALTLGVGVDRLISKAQVTDMARAVVLDACAGALAEKAQQALLEAAGEALGRDGRFMTMGYSPGYGDFPLETQREIIRLLDTQKKVGLTVNTGGLLTPVKSITAVAGVASRPVTGKLAGCESCLLRGKCVYGNGKKCWQ